MPRRTFYLLALVVVLSGRLSYADLTADRGRLLLEYYYGKYKDSDTRRHKPRETINWAYAALALNKDIPKANQALITYLADKHDFFTKQGSEGHSLYWELNIMTKICADVRLSSKLTGAADQAIKAVLWDFVKNFEEPDYADTSPEKLLRIFNSDNHDIIHKGLCLMTAQILKNDADWAGKSYPDGTRAAEHYQIWKNYLMEYFRRRAQNGICVEFGSACYAGVYLQPIFIVADCCEDQSLRRQARKFLDLYFADVAQEVLNGIRGGAKVRMYKNALSLQGYQDTLLWYNYILSGRPAEPPTKQLSTSCFAAAVTSYRLPEIIKTLAANPRAKGSYRYISNRLAQGTLLILDRPYAPEPRYSRAPLYFPHRPSAFLRYSYCTGKYILGWFTIDEECSYMAINTQNQWMGVITAAGPDSRIVVELTATSDGRTGYNELQAVGDKHAVIIKRQCAAGDKSRLRIYLSNDFSVNAESGWFFGRNGDKSVYYAFTPTAAQGPVLTARNPADHGPGRWIRFDNPRTALILELALAEQYPGFTAFENDIVNREPLWSENQSQLTYQPSRHAAKLTMFTDKRIPLINGSAAAVHPPGTYDSPYLQSDTDSGVITVSAPGGETLTLDFNYNQR